jgi:ABC-2 type transport system ATP-binding protein
MSMPATKLTPSPEVSTSATLPPVHTNGEDIIELRRLHRYFGATKAVNDVTFSVPRGQVFGYIGPNGAGKTTSMRILATLDLPTYGDAFVDGFSVINDPDRVRRRLGFMPDSFGTYANVNCWEYLDFYARAYGLVGRDRHRALRHVMGFTGLDKLAEKPISGLSKGMKQRLCLGRSMIHNPGVLILDEPAAGLDPRARIELREMIGQLAAGDGKTILVSSHILTELAEMCDRVGIIERGTLLATGSVEEIHRQLETHREVRVRLLERIADAAAWLREQPDVHEVREEGELLRFSHPGTRTEEAQLLRQMIEAGLSVAEFRSEEKSLEDVFMHVTQGHVQ